MTTITETSAPGKFTAKDTDTEVQSHAKVWLACRVQEDAAKVATKDRKTAAEHLHNLLSPDDTVTLNGNTTYKWIDRVDQAADTAAMLKACEVLHPGITATLARIKAEDADRKKAGIPQLYTTPRVVRELKLANR